MPISAFPGLRRYRPRSAAVSDVTLRDFSGGFRATDNEISLQNRFATKLVNMFADEDTSQVLRFGTKKFATCSANVINQVYFRQHIICALSNGHVQSINDDGVVTTIWSPTIAGMLPGSPEGWSTVITSIDFTEFRGDLIITNGIDKPIIVDNVLSVKYLEDLASGSNINVPISRFVTTVSNYTVMAGIDGFDTSIFISATGTSGTWPGDADPNDATSFDVGAFTGQASSKIFAISSFKNFLMVFFDNFSIALQLGVFNEAGVHTPTVNETYANLGTVNNKTFLTTDSDLIFASNIGVFSAARDVLGGSLTTNPMAQNLGDVYTATLGLVPKNNLDSFIINDTLSKTLFLSFHKNDGAIKTFAMRYRDGFTRISWAEIHGWSFTSSCSTEKGRVFFGQDDSIYQYGNSVFENEEYYADYITDSFEGNEIEFDWEFPWLDAGNRIKTKQLKKVNFDTTGSSMFSLQCFVDNFYRNTQGNLAPAVEMSFVAGNAGGYGNNADGYGGDGFGGGRRANDERFYGFPIKFRILKMRFFGATRKPLRIVSISLIYLRGNYNV